jgi:endonuclease V-like protein UPF0215 family
LKLVKLKQVKKEIRILGISSKKFSEEFRIIGTVFKGKIGLDGVLSSTANSKDLTDPIIKMVLDSHHKNQIRIILIDFLHLPEETSIDPKKIWKRLSKPVLSMNWTDSVADFYWGKIPVLSIGLSRLDAFQVLKKSSLKKCIPEALRISQLIVSCLPKKEA